MAEMEGPKEAGPLERLAAVLPRRGRVLVIPHNYPDPDALASAAGVRLLLERRFGLTGQIAFTGTVSRAENRELLRHLRCPWRLTADLRPTSRRVPTVFVDTSPWSGNVTVPSFAEPVAVIDHHPLRRTVRRWNWICTDIREGAGATATMVHEYLQAAGVVPPRWLATIMAYAIATETLDLSRDCSDEDLRAYVALVARANLSVLGRIRHAPLPRVYFGRLQEATRNALVYGRVVWTHLESVEQPEIVAEIADLLLRLERATWAFCMARLEDRLVVSLRSSDPRARCGRLLKRALGPGGVAGGHHRMAAGFVPLGGLDPAQAQARREALARDLVARIDRRSARTAGAGEPLPAQPLVDAALAPRS